MRALLSKLSATALGILGLTATAVDSSAQTTVLVGWTNTWAYNDETTSAANLHGTGWELPGYDISSAPGWKSGPALFGNDGGGIYDGVGRPFSGGVNGFLTPLNRAISGASDRVTFYFRNNFTFNGSATDILEAKWVHDDGIVVYINGTEAFRSKMQVPAPDPVTWDTFGANHDAAGFPPVVVEGFEYSMDLDSSLLVQGENTIAVELHQSSTTSSDCSFALQLSSITPFAPTFVDANQPTNRTLLQFRGSVLSAEATGRPFPTYQWFEDGFAIDGATSSTLVITNESTDTVTRKYFCRVSNSVGTIDSREASVLFTADSTPPSVVTVSQGADFKTVIVSYDEAIDPISGTDFFTYHLSDGITEQDPSLVTLNPDGRSVTVSYEVAMQENAVHTITIAGVGDVALNYMAEVNVQFTSWVSTDCGGVLFEAFDTADTQGTPINLLTGHPNYPNNPRETYRLRAFTTRARLVSDDTVPYGDDSHEQYGGRLRALFIPPTSGNWVFYLSSDDAGQLFFNPNGASEAGKILVQNETGCCNPYSSHATAPFALEAGHAYYLEAIYKEGGGGDYCHVWAGPQGTLPPSAAAASLTEADAIPGSMLGAVAAPANVAGTFTITQQPADQQAVPNSVATFSVGTSTDAFKCYKWFRNGVEIPNANNSSYSVTVTSGDNGAKFSVQVSVVGGNTETSAEATLTVGADTVRPTVVSVSANAAGDTLTVTYSEAMGVSAASGATYTVNGTPASSATLNAAGTVATVVLGTPLTAGGCTLSQISINGAADQAGNLINPDPTVVSLSSPYVEILALGATWKYEDSGTDLGTAWRATAFDDSAWQSGPAPLGFEPAATQVPVVATAIAAGTATHTAYFRTHFTLGVNPANVVVLQLSQIADDGAVYYLNGVEILRTRMPAAPAAIEFATLATAGGPEPSDGTHTMEVVNLPKTALVAGDNVLAVELHPNSVTSSDSEFAAQLHIVQCVPSLSIQHVGAEIKLTWSDAAYHLETSTTPNGPWTRQAGGSGLQLPAAAGNGFFRLVTP